MIVNTHKSKKKEKKEKIPTPVLNHFSYLTNDDDDDDDYLVNRTNATKSPLISNLLPCSNTLDENNVVMTNNIDDDHDDDDIVVTTVEVVKAGIHWPHEICVIKNTKIK